MPRASRRRWWRLVVVGAVAAEIASAGVARPFTIPADLVVSIALAALVAVVVVQHRVHPAPSPIARRPPTVEPHPVAAWWPWLVLLAVVSAWELFCFATSPRPDHPTLSYLLDLVTVHAAGRAVAFTGWVALGGYLVTR